MKPTAIEDDSQLIANALESARDTKLFVVNVGCRHRAQHYFQTEFGDARAAIIADEYTYRAAGANVVASFADADHACVDPCVLKSPLHAEYSRVEELVNTLANVDAIPVVVGSGTLNDLTKLAAHKLNRPYMVVATAASMDGYTAYGASITRHGSKQTFDCPAPRAVLADLEVIAGAPAGMNASGYADLAAKCAAGGDWILADAVGEEPIDDDAWNAVQGPLRRWLARPEGVAAGEPHCLNNLINGLMMSGFVMQAVRSSRPASGADHQFSHLWDMQNHTHNGEAPSHGFKVGIGTLSSLALYDDLLTRDLSALDIDAAVSRWPSLDAMKARIAELLGTGDLAAKAIEETTVKYVAPEHLRAQLEHVRTVWPQLRQRLQRDLPRFAELRGMLRAARCPVTPEEIGISRERLRVSYEQAWYIRRRYTVLDFIQRAGIADSIMDRIFGDGGAWSDKPHAA